MAEVVREMFISHDSSESRVAILEDGVLVEFYLERAKRSVVGDTPSISASSMSVRWCSS